MILYMKYCCDLISDKFRQNLLWKALIWHILVAFYACRILPSMRFTGSLSPRIGVLKSLISLYVWKIGLTLNCNFVLLLFLPCIYENRLNLNCNIGLLLSMVSLFSNLIFQNERRCQNLLIAHGLNILWLSMWTTFIEWVNPSH